MLRPRAHVVSVGVLDSDDYIVEVSGREPNMIPLSDLKKAAAEGLAFLKQQDDIEEAEVFVSSNGVLLTRLNYTSHIPSQRRRGAEVARELRRRRAGCLPLRRWRDAQGGLRLGAVRHLARGRPLGAREGARRAPSPTRSSRRSRARRASSARSSITTTRS